MDNKEFYNLLIGDLKRASLSPRQIREAILNRALKEDVEIVDGILKEQFASWIPSGMIPIGNTGFDFDASGSYVSRVEKNNKEQSEENEIEIEESPTPEAEEAAMKRKQLVDQLVEAAFLAEKKGLIKQASILDEVLTSLV
jgi:hypothetical protein